MVKRYQNANELDFIFMALAHQTRRGILERLKSGKSSAQDLALPFSVSLPAISKHLKILERAQLVKRVVQGRQHFFTVESEKLQNAMNWVSSFEVFWEEKLDKLEVFLDSEIE